MANKTVKDAVSVHAVQNPQFLLSNIVRPKILEDAFWKEFCFGINAADVCDVCVDHVRSVGATYGGRRRPSKFLCLLLKLLQIQPDLEIIKAYIAQKEFRYLRCLGATYLRMIGDPELIYSSLEPWYSDSRRICKRNIDGSISVTHVDEFMHALLSERQLLDDVAFYELPQRVKMEELDRLDAYESPLADELEQLELEKNIREDEEQRQKEKEQERADRQKRREEREAREKARREARERRNGAMEQGPQTLPAIKEEEEDNDKHNASDNEKDEAAEKKSRAGSDSEKSALPKKAKQREGSEHASAPGSPSRASGASSPKRRPSRSAERGRSHSGDAAHPADRDGRRENKHDRGLGRNKTTRKTSSRDPGRSRGTRRSRSNARHQFPLGRTTRPFSSNRSRGPPRAGRREDGRAGKSTTTGRSKPEQRQRTNHERRRRSTSSRGSEKSLESVQSGGESRSGSRSSASSRPPSPPAAKTKSRPAPRPEETTKNKRSHHDGKNKARRRDSSSSQSRSASLESVDSGSKRKKRKTSRPDADGNKSRGKEPAASKKQQSSNADVSSKHSKKKSSRHADESDRRGKTAKEQLEALQNPDEIQVDPSIPRHLLMQHQKPKLPPPGTKKYNDGDDDDKPEVVYQAPKKPRNPDLPSEDDDSDYLENFSTQKKYLDINPNKTSLFGVKAKNEKKEKKRQKEREKAEAKAEEAKKGRKKEYTKEELEEIANENKRRAELGIQPLRL